MSEKVRSRQLAIKAKCSDCMGNYKDGRADCCVTACPLYSFMPYAEHEPDLSWMNSGKPKRKMSKEQREAARTRLAEYRKKKGEK